MEACERLVGLSARAGGGAVRQRRGIAQVRVVGLRGMRACGLRERGRLRRLAGREFDGATDQRGGRAGRRILRRGGLDAVGKFLGLRNPARQHARLARKRVDDRALGDRRGVGLR